MLTYFPGVPPERAVQPALIRAIYSHTPKKVKKNDIYYDKTQHANLPGRGLEEVRGGGGGEGGAFQAIK